MNSKVLNKKAKELCQKYKGKEIDKNIQLPLTAQYKLLSSLGDPLGKVYDKYKSEFKNFLKTRNHSILAHGEQTVTAKKYHKMKSFVEKVIKEALSLDDIEQQYCKFPQLQL